MAKRAVVLEVKEKTCTVLTAEGEFREIKKGASYRPGQEIIMPAAVFGAGKYSLIAACLLFFLVAATLWGRGMTPAVAAYVSLDINPSVEMALDKENMVIGIAPLNDDGRDLISGLTVKGLGVEIAIEKLVEAAVSRNFIVPGEESVILSAVTSLGGDPARTETLVAESIKVSVSKHSIKAQIVVGEVPPGNREKAAKAGISAGRYMIFLDASKESGDVNPEDFKEKGRFKNEIIKKVKAEKGSGGEPEGGGKKNNSGKSVEDGGQYSESAGKKLGKESGPGGGKSHEGAGSHGRAGEDRPGSTGAQGPPGVLSNPGQRAEQAGEGKENSGSAKVEKEKDKSRANNDEKDKTRGEGDQVSPDRDGKKGAAGSHGMDSPRQKDKGRD
ncbi:MAG: anti-sigma factor domain-containing protein [Bacillota bacterium]